MLSYGSVWPIYARQWDSMSIRPSRLNEFRTIAKRLFNAKERYVNVQNKTGVPWYMIAVIHEREASQNWNTQLAQGDPLHRKSIHVPSGMGPYDTWEDGALAALKHDGLSKVIDWRLEKILYHLEAFNGWGYANHGVPSAYVWAGSTVYTRGKYVADGVWSSTAVDTQPGCAPLIKCLMELDPTVKPERESDTPPKIKVAEAPTEPASALKPVAFADMTPTFPVPNTDQVMSIVRAVLLAAGTILGTLGVITDAIWTAISGVALSLVPVAWSMYVHKQETIIATAATIPDVVSIEVKPTTVGLAVASKGV